MDPISVGLLTALVSGAGGQLGRQSWGALTALVRRPFQRSATSGAEPPQISSGAAELSVLEEASSDAARAGAAQSLSVALAVRAALDAEFQHGLRQWHDQAKSISFDESSVHNSITGGTQNGPVIQGRDFSNITFGTPGQHPPSPSQS